MLRFLFFSALVVLVIPAVQAQQFLRDYAGIYYGVDISTGQACAVTICDKKMNLFQGQGGAQNCQVSKSATLKISISSPALDQAKVAELPYQMPIKLEGTSGYLRSPQKPGGDLSIQLKDGDLKTATSVWTDSRIGLIPFYLTCSIQSVK